MVEENYVVMEKDEICPNVTKRDTAGQPKVGKAVEQKGGKGDPPRGDRNIEGDDNIPGLHKHLPKSHLADVMGPYLSTDGYYLLRPSSTSQGQLSLTVSYNGTTSSYKINCDNNQYYINTKKRFDSVKQLLEFYRNAPIKSKQREEEIYLLYPIPVDMELELQFEKQAESKKATKVDRDEEALPEPWKQYYSQEHRRYYYYNPLTEATVWERPRVSSKEERKCMTLPPRRSTKIRPLPEVPPSTAAVTLDSDVPSSSTFATKRSSRESTSEQEQGKKVSMKDRALPSIPPRETTRPQLPLPKEDSAPQQPTQPNFRERRSSPAKDGPRAGPASAPVPSREEGSARSLPPLPEKEDAEQKPLPPLPARSGESAGPKLPPSLPTKEDSGKKALPSLPPKNEEVPPPSIVRHSSIKGQPSRQQDNENVQSQVLGVNGKENRDGPSPKLPTRAGS